MEKALKAILIFLQQPFPFIHDLETLQREMPDGWTARDQPVDFEALTEWAAAGRCPTDKPEPDVPEARIAVPSARLVLEAAARDLAAKGVGPEG